MGIINWIQPFLGLTTPQLSPLFNILKSDPQLTSPSKLTPEAKTTLKTAEWAITSRPVYRLCPEVSITIFIIIAYLHLTCIIGQWDTQSSDPRNILEWIFLPHKPKKTAPTIFLIDCTITY